MMLKIFCWCIFLSVVNCRNASEWRSRSIYQILTDRFASEEFPLRCTESPLTENITRNYCGGTYKGAIKYLDYIVELGFDALWISPIPSNVDGETIYGVGWHGYWQDHLLQLNHNFGTEQDLIEFVQVAHERDIWIMVDVVANHVGPNLTTDYFPFDKSEYFHSPLCFIDDFSNQTQVEFCSVGNAQVPLPDLNTENKFVQSTFYSWIHDTVIKYQFDGIRVDTFRHVQKPFWANYTRASGVYSVGEVATSETEYVGDYTNYADGVLHYPLYFVLNVTFRDDPTLRQSMRALENQVRENGKYFKDTTLCGTFLDNQDRNRFLSYTQNPTRIQNALVYLLFSDGIPILYMGTEQNYTGNPNVANGATDPWNRDPLWRSSYDRSNWIFQFVRRLNKIRSMFKNNDEYKQFFTSTQQTLYIDNDTYVYQKGPIIIAVSNQEFTGTKYVKLPTVNRRTGTGWNNYQVFNLTNTINANNELEINDWHPIILVPVSSGTSFSSFFTLFTLFFVFLCQLE